MVKKLLENEKGVPPIYHNEKIKSPEGEPRIVMIDDLANGHFLPITQDEVDKLKSHMKNAKKDLQGRYVHNGLFEPVWLVQFDDGSLHIANGYHRYQAVYELSRDDEAFDPSIYATIFPGDEKLLWKLRLQGAGDHKKVAPARFIHFMMESFNGQFKDVKLELVARAMMMNEDQRVQIRPKGVSASQWNKSLDEIKQVTSALGFTPEQVQDYLAIMEGIPEGFIDQIRTKPNRKELDGGAIPLLSAVEIARSALNPDQKTLAFELLTEEKLSQERVAFLITAIINEKGTLAKKELIRAFINPKVERQRLERGMRIPSQLIEELSVLRVMAETQTVAASMNNVVAHIFTHLFVTEELQSLSIEARKTLVAGIIAYSQSHVVLRENKTVLLAMRNGEASQIARQFEEVIVPYIAEKGDQITAKKIEKLLLQVKLRNFESLPEEEWKLELVEIIKASLRDLLTRAFVPLGEYIALLKSK